MHHPDKADSDTTQAMQKELIVDVEVDVEQEDTSAGSECIIRPFNPNEIEIETPPFTVGYLMDMIEHKEINMNTEFQRENDLWSNEKQSRLIESILLGLPLPAFYFDTSNPQWDIIDGLQRCCSIANFCVHQTLRLTGLEFLGYKEDGSVYLEGKKFDDLDRTLQRSIITRPITINKIKKASKEVRYILFRRLNTGGLELTPPEIRNAIYQGVPANTIKELAAHDLFKQATGGRIPTKRMEDRDFVSRFIAFYINDFTQYEPGLDDFINKSLEKLYKKEIDLAKLKEDFIHSLQLVIDIFGDDAFRKRVSPNERRKPINKAYFEVITTSFAKLSPMQREQLKTHQEVLKTNLMTLMQSDRYSRALSGGTGTKDSVNIRFSWFQKVLEKSLSGTQIRVTDDYKIESR